MNCKNSKIPILLCQYSGQILNNDCIFVVMSQNAKYWIKIEGDKVECQLCPHRCIISPGRYGKCRVRKNEAGILVSAVYGKICSYCFDPIEKKPLYHFHPGRQILSLGSVGCNLRCSFCQNDTISQTTAEAFPRLNSRSPQEVVALAGSRVDNIGVAYTYNEPIVWFEFMMDVAVQIKKTGMKNVVVTNGYVEPEPLAELIGVVDAFSVDLKGFTEQFYSEMTSASLQPVLNSLKQIAQSDKHLEVVNLIIPGKNDDPDIFRDMISFIRTELGKDTVLHLSRYYPHYKMNESPMPVGKMYELQKLAKEELLHVYLGNMPH